MIWFFLWSILTVEGHTVDVQFNGFSTQQECETFRDALTSHAQSVHGSSATICQQRAR